MIERIERDADTGEEIIFFIRRGRPYLYLRRAIAPKLFIKRLHYIEIRTCMVVEYSLEQARKGNPLYLDTEACTLIGAEDFFSRRDIAEKLREPIKRVVTIKFGRAVAQKILKDAGVEYGSIPHYRTEYKDRKCTVLLVWKHRKEEKPTKFETEEKV